MDTDARSVYRRAVPKPTDAEIKAFATKIEALPPSARIWVLPIYQVLSENGGRGRPKEVEERIYEHIADKIRPGQWAHALRKQSIPFTRNVLRKLGGIAGERGTWEWTPLGREYWKRAPAEPFQAPADLPELSPEETGDITAPPETVEATALQGYIIPILDLLAQKPMTGRAITETLKSGQLELLPGDFRFAPNGDQILRTRISFALAELKGNDEIRNLGRGEDWEITDAGRARLHNERSTWKIEDYRGSFAKVRRKAAPATTQPAPAPHLEAEEDTDDPVVEAEVPWHPAMWAALRDELPADVFEAADARLRPDLGPTPNGLPTPLMRNLILYGPPGTGKTRAALMIAEALTNEERPSDSGRFQLVQFHPNYTYEDFIRGLRPDLGQSGGLHYRYYKGPLLHICERAQNDPDRFYVILIDEINRGDPARIFGEALFAIEYRGYEVRMPGDAILNIPPNLVVIGTMNSVDRSIALMDFALRRRFGFLYMQPALAAAEARFAHVTGISHALAAFEKLNAWLHQRLGPEHVLGHSFLLSPATPLDRVGSLDQIWRLEVRPLLQEYLFSDREGLAQIEAHWADWCASARRAGFTG